MKKLLLAISMCFILVLTGCGSKVDDSTAQKYYEMSESIIVSLNESKYEDVVAHFNEEMKGLLTAEQLAQVTPALIASGDYKEISKKSMEEKDGMKIVVMVADYSKDKRIFTITFDANDQVAGLYVQ